MEGSEVSKRGQKPQPVPQDKADSLVEWITNGNTIAAWCRENGVGVSTVYDWTYKDDEFAGRIAHARELGEEVIAQQCLDIANAPVIGEETEEDETGKMKIKRGDMLGHRKLQIETRLKLLAKWNPKKWGEKQQLEHSGQIGLESLIAGANGEH